MKLTAINCFRRCKRIFYVLCEEGFDTEGLNGVYSCPKCRERDIHISLKPVDILPPKITIIKEGQTIAVICLAKPQTSPVAEQPGQGGEVPGEQLPGAGLRDNESRKGPSEELEKQAPDGFLESGSRSPYEEEVSKYLGVKCDPKFIF
jgi:hypothetical protein